MDYVNPSVSGPVAYLHIGTPKTGTTSFQRWASAKRAELASKTGLDYYKGPNTNNGEFAMLCMRRNRNMPMRVGQPDWCLDDWQRVATTHIRDQVARRGGPLFVSSESMSYLRYADEIERLAELLQPREVFVLVALRDPIAFLHSYGRQLQNQGFARSHYRHSFAYVAEDSWLVDYDGLLDAYRNVFGANHVIVVNYEPAVQQYGSIIPALLEPLGFGPAQIPAWEGWSNNVTGPRNRAHGHLQRLRRARSRRRAWRDAR